MPNFSALESKKNQLIRKATGGSLFLAPTSATVPAALTTSDGSLAALGTGWTDGGLMTDDGMAWARSVDVSDITSFGQTAPTRSDVTSDEETVEVNFQETSLLTIALFTGSAQAALVPTTGSGELQIAKPDRPSPRRYRALGIAVDENSAGEIYIAKLFPNAKVSDYADQAFSKGDDAISWGVTLTAERDATLGYAVKWFFGGPGWKALLADMGFTVGS